ncbi:MAG: diadenylate cyclase CdaA [Cytophagales bacterium]|nr:diadenylate cyclase CdaA [Cytophagales bacterium]
MIWTFNIGFLNISLVDIVDILFVTFLLYQLYKLVEGSVAIWVFLGFLLLYLIYFGVSVSGMELATAILGQFMEVGVLAAIILFQQEIRKFLFLMGRTTSLNKNQLFKRLPWPRRTHQLAMDITPIVEAAKALGGSNTGALIVFSEGTKLKFYAESGDLIDTIISKRLLMAIFNKQSPLHDGAVIIYGGRIVAARCILPVTERQNLPPHFGLRHRAAIGMTEVTDTLVLVVSEETGQMSIARNGTVKSNLSVQEIRTAINDYLCGED